MIHDFFALLVHGFWLFRAETTQLPVAVLAWMWVMRVVLGASIIFLPRPGAVATFAVMLTTALSRFYVKGAYPGIPAAHIGAITHIVLWTPLAIVLLVSLRRRGPNNNSILDRAYRPWLMVAVAVMAVSLVFDIHEALAIIA